MSDKPLLPFLKWAGGKRWLSPALSPLLVTNNGTYFEPFLGGGALFFALNPHRAVLADVNRTLILVYETVRDYAGEVINRLNQLTICPSEYRRIREVVTTDQIQQAVHFLYLNRTAFNGLYRVNRQGRFNVPFGCKPGTQLCNEDLLRQCAMRLSQTELKAQDFRESLLEVRPDDCVFIDPPYARRQHDDGFRRYNHHLFSWNDQIELADRCNELVRLGTRIVITNAFHEEVLKLYDRTIFSPWSVLRESSMAANREKRGGVYELLLVSETVKGVPTSTPAARITALC